MGTRINKLIADAAASDAAVPVKKYIRRLLETYYNAAVVDRLSTKTAPLSLAVSSSEPRRVNLIIPEINFDCFYGGYIAKFNLARLLAARGRRVRIVTVDPCPDQPERWRERMRNYAGLEDVFEHVEVACRNDRAEPLTVNKDDAFIATTWWTAYIAHAAVTQLAGKPFVYLIQEYEPFTFPMGAYHAMARSSYELPHYALYSTALLEEYFQQQHVGIYGNGPAAGGAGTYFENAILRFQEDELGFRQRVPSRLLFYARPEAHAARNMFEIGYLSLGRAIEESVFDSGWEFHGIGSNHKDIPLPNGQRLKMIGVVGLDEYRRLLPRFDVGLSLMYTPHPSLLPLEMAAAGMRVVTNECLNKTRESLQSISTNVYGADPTVDGVVAGLRAAVETAGDMDSRLRGARVNWASSWEQAFDSRVLDFLDGCLDETAKDSRGKSPDSTSISEPGGAKLTAL